MMGCEPQVNALEQHLTSHRAEIKMGSLQWWVWVLETFGCHLFIAGLRWLFGLQIEIRPADQNIVNRQAVVSICVLLYLEKA